MRRLLWISLLLAACDDVPINQQTRPEGIVRPPEGVIQGTLVYRGFKPLCEYDDAGTPLRVPGRAILSLYRFDEPPAPEGSASSPSSFLVVPGDELFPDPIAHCRARDAMVPELILRSAFFTWPSLPLGEDFQIRGFYDQRGAWSPLFFVQAQLRSGDFQGAAVDNVEALGTGYPPVLTRVSFEDAAQRPLGQLVDGVVVSLAQPVNTEPPVFRRLGNDLDAQSTIPPIPDPIAQEQALWELTETRLELIAATDEDYARAFAIPGLDFDFSPLVYAWNVRTIDIVGGADGEIDLHPILSTPSAPVPWYTPLYTLERRRTPEEVAAGIPTATLIGSIRPTQLGVAGEKEVFAPSIDMLVPPIAVVDLDPALGICQVAYVPPNNIAPLYEGNPSDCQELPTGAYSHTVLNGIANGIPAPAPPEVSDTGFTISGGSFTTQAWRIPNELGPPDRVANPLALDQLDPADQIEEQGPGAMLTVFDSNPDNGVRNATSCLASIDPALSLTEPRLIVYTPVPGACCDNVRQLCDLPLCDVADGVRVTRSSDGTLDCVPFEMPASCCN